MRTNSHGETRRKRLKLMKTETSMARTGCPKRRPARLRTAWTGRLLLLALLVLALAGTAKAQFSYAYNNGALTLTGYTGPGGAVSIPDVDGLVTSIGMGAFMNCASLTSIGIPGSVTNIGADAFAYCSGLTSVGIPGNVTSIGEEAFAYCGSLTGVGIPGSVANIGERAFAGCAKLASVGIPNGVSSIGASAFAGTSLARVAIPKSVTSIGENAFGSCSRLTAITVDALNSAYSSSVDGVLFNKNQTTLAQYPGGKAGGYAVPNSVTSIQDDAFADCASLTSLTIPNSVTNIGDGAFGSCAGLTNLTIGNGVSTIGLEAFAGCSSLTNVTLPNNLTRIGDGAFDSCASLSTITVGALNSAYSSSVDGVLFNKSQTTLVQYPGGKAGGYAIPNGVTNVQDSAFAGCFRLTSLTIPSSVTSIGDYAFDGCTGLTNVAIPGSVASIGNSAFAGCTSLAGVAIPNGLTSIGNDAFGSCNNLVSVDFQGNAPGAGSDAFDGDNLAVLYYLPGATGWGPLFAERPTVLWNPQVQTSGASFGVRTNQFGFTITAASGLSVVVEASTNLANPTWLPLATNTLTGGSSYFSDPQWTNYPARFYRLRLP